MELEKCLKVCRERAQTRALEASVGLRNNGSNSFQSPFYVWAIFAPEGFDLWDIEGAHVLQADFAIGDKEFDQIDNLDELKDLFDLRFRHAVMMMWEKATEANAAHNMKLLEEKQHEEAEEKWR